MEKVYTMQEVMEILKVSMQVVTAELTSGRLKSFRIGRQWRVAESNLIAYIHGEVGTVEPKVDIIEDIPDHTEYVPPVMQEQPGQLEDTSKTILLMKADGKSLKTIADYLNEVGSTNKGKSWNKDSVNRVCHKAKETE